MKQIEISKELDLKDVVEILSLNTKNAFQYEKEENGIRCRGPFYVEGRYSTQNEVNAFQDVFTFDIFAANEKLDGTLFELVYTGYEYSVVDTCVLTLYFDVHGIFAEEINTSTNLIEAEAVEKTIDSIEESGFAMIEELFDEKDSVVSSYSLIVVKHNDSYESIAERYKVDVNTLKEVNQHKEISEKDVIVLPYK